MAKKRAKQATDSPILQKVQFKQLKILLNDDADIPSYYVNYAEITQGMHEFSLYVAKVPGRLSAETLATVQETNELRVDPLLQIVFPPTLLPGLLRALTLQKDSYESMHGEIRDPSSVQPPVGQLLS
ncbi:MAG TPA: hypothetical protein VGI90_09830 [Steroidobacteraceae bacterium]|jgi:hypothetical protein